MQVERGLQVLLLCPLQEALRRGKQASVPGVACPAATCRLGIMPVHIYDEHVERNVVVVHLRDEVAQLVVAVRPVARPPVAEGVARRQWHLARKLGIVA